MTRTLLVLPLMCAIISVGCGQQSASPRQGRDAEEGAAKVAAAPAPAGGGELPRKIIYNANVDLIVDDFDKAKEQLSQLIKENKGFIAQSVIRGATGAPRSGEWTVRVPVDQFRKFVGDLAKLGEVRESKTDSDDVTDRYYDLKAHIQNDKAEEESLRKLMVDKTATGKLDDLLAVRRELRELRGKIDAQQGQMERLDKEAAMTAVVVQIQDRKDYVPAISPTFGASIYTTFTDSLAALLAFARGAVLVVVAVSPWIVVIAPLAGGLWWFLRKWRWHFNARPKPGLPEV